MEMVKENSGSEVDGNIAGKLVAAAVATNRTKEAAEKRKAVLGVLVMDCRIPIKPSSEPAGRRKVKGY